MSGHQLRIAARNNDVETIRRLSFEKSNPCSTDENGLSPLHYAVWNGHVECVKYLLMNPKGVTKTKERTTCLNLQSSVGYTALHLVALECPKESIREITTCLLLVGCDVKLLDKNNRTAYTIAREVGNTEFIEVFRHYVDVMSGKADATAYKMQLQALQTAYCLHPPTPIPIEQQEGKRLIDDVATYFELNKELQKAIQIEKQQGHTLNKRGSRLEREAESAATLRPHFENTAPEGEVPLGMAFHERLILPISEYAFLHEKDSITALQVLRFADFQAQQNVQRRQKLLESSGLNFEPLLAYED